MSQHSAPRHRSAIAFPVLLLTLLTFQLTSGSARAHERKDVGDFRLTVGWGDEPAFSGSRNAVEIDVADMAGRPVTDLGGGNLSVEVSFGAEHVALPLHPAPGPPGKFSSLLLPTRPGTYTFHITGTVKGQAIDVTSTCSEQTFACVLDASEIQFPVKDPSAGQMAERISRELSRADVAMETAASARKIGIGALATALLALAAAASLGWRKTRTGGA